MQIKNNPHENKLIGVAADPLALLNVEQARLLLGCSRGTLYNVIRSGEIRPIKIRSSTRFRRSEIERYLSALADTDCSAK
jgi:excisionase family DNA binding protein